MPGNLLANAYFIPLYEDKQTTSPYGEVVNQLLDNVSLERDLSYGFRVEDSEKVFNVFELHCQSRNEFGYDYELEDLLLTLYQQLTKGVNHG